MDLLDEGHTHNAGAVVVVEVVIGWWFGAVGRSVDVLAILNQRWTPSQS